MSDHHHESSERFTDKREVDGARDAMPAWQRWADSVADSARFGNVVICVIVVNAITIGLETYPALENKIGTQLDVLDRIFLAFFTCELLIRLAATKFHPRAFFSRGWNVFDFLVVSLAYVPGLGANSTALRLVRLLRVARLLSVVPDVQVLLDGVRRAMRPALGLVLLTVLLVYLYAIVGWSLFGEEDPEHWGTAGEASLTLFQLLTLEGWNEILSSVRGITWLAVPYILSFILMGTFVVLNLVIGVVITSLDQAHAEARRDQGAGAIDEAIHRMRESLSDLERQLDAAPQLPLPAAD